MRSSRAITRLLRALAAAVLLMLPAIVTTAGATPAPPGWSAAWTTALYRADRFVGPNWAEQGFTNQTLRQVVRVTQGGAAARIVLSNRFGTTPLRIGGANVARGLTDAGIVPETLRTLTFGNAVATEIPPGAELATDPVLLPLAPFDELSITLYLTDATGPVTQHSQAFETAYRADGDQRADTGGAPFTETTAAWYYLSRVEVADILPRTAGIVAFGDSITDGVGSTVDAGNRFPDELAELLAAQGTPRAVLNQGIGGNRVTVDSGWMGESALRRFRHDVLDQPGIATVIILEGINDIGLSVGAPEIGEPAVPVSAEQLIAGYRELIAQARARGLRVIGATMLPMEGSPYYSAAAEAERAAVNQWIRASGEYDAVIDFDAALADPAAPRRLAAPYDSGDHLHPSDAGYTAMAAAAAAVDLG
ncbi:SGNH/GDSL hydrolase family protein [Nocardia yamanashiensis]|uniref:SGNH/GDSL hydrolase family protein n=1 Tax=Nocardia yamanashiensis TaxID=209247 RepID=UPI001E55A589|nr:SGNH/GDSL hydrolase family protein [Nocardia yamanashiensis]UGT45510.1 SGNH/GDSL hydrolase family protein [Nocardia yamanashiensis]